MKFKLRCRLCDEEEETRLKEYLECKYCNYGRYTCSMCRLYINLRNIENYILTLEI